MSNTSPINFTVVFSESVNGFTTGDVTLSGTAGATTAVVTGSGTTYNVAVSGMTGDGTVIASIGAGVASDQAGNLNTASTSTDNTVTYDATAPSVVLSGGGTGTTNVATFGVTAQFSETVTGFTSSDVVVTNGTVSNFSAVDGDTYTFDVTATASGTVTVNVPAASAVDGANNPNTASNTLSWIYDATAPSVTINQAVGQADPTNTNPINFTAVFSEPVTGFTGSDVTISGTAGGTKTVVVTGSGTTYNVAVSGMTTNGTVIASIPAGSNAPSSSGAQDAAGNGNSASTSTDNTVTWDATSAYTLQYLQPLDQSTTTNIVINTGKNGRVIPVKNNVFASGVLQTNTQIAEGRLTIGVNAAQCASGVATDAVETYADAGQSSAGTNQFRYSGGWIYNLDTKALGMVSNSCYRLDVYLDGFKISTQTFAIFKHVN